MRIFLVSFRALGTKIRGCFFLFCVSTPEKFENPTWLFYFRKNRPCNHAQSLDLTKRILGKKSSVRPNMTDMVKKQVCVFQKPSKTMKKHTSGNHAWGFGRTLKRCLGTRAPGNKMDFFEDSKNPFRQAWLGKNTRHILDQLLHVIIFRTELVAHSLTGLLLVGLTSARGRMLHYRV